MRNVTFQESSVHAYSLNHFNSHPFFSIRDHGNEPVKVTDQIARIWWPLPKNFSLKEKPSQDQSTEDQRFFLQDTLYTLSEGLPRMRGKDLLLSRGRDDGFDLARCSRTKRPKRPTDEGNVEGERICGARLMVRRSMNPILLTPLSLPSDSTRPIISQTLPLFGRGRMTSSDCSTEVVRVRSRPPGVLNTRL